MEALLHAPRDEHRGVPVFQQLAEVVAAGRREAEVGPQMAHPRNAPDLPPSHRVTVSHRWIGRGEQALLEKASQAGSDQQKH